MTIHPTFTGDAAATATFRSASRPDAAPPPGAAAPRPTPKAAPDPAPSSASAQGSGALPADFVYDSEHPVLSVPFHVLIEGEKLEGVGLSATAAHVRVPGELDPEMAGSRHLARLQFDFEGFTISLFPEVKVGPGPDGSVALTFADPTGPHLRQLRYILNAYIAGEVVALDGMLGYAGPLKPKGGSDAPDVNTWRGKLRRVASVAASVGLIVLAGSVIVQRYVTSHEVRPVFFAREGNEMRATAGGQITYLDQEADAGEVVYAVAANSGDLLNFRIPCDCTVELAPGVYEGATLLPGDQILTFFDDTVSVSMRTQMSVEGLNKALAGERVYLDISDGRTLPVQVIQDERTRAAADEGELFVPVKLIPEEGHEVTPEDIGKAAKLRIVRPILGTLLN